MASDLLAEFDSFYKSPQTPQPNPTVVSNDPSILNDGGQNGQLGHFGQFSQWQSAPTKTNNDIWAGGLANFQGDAILQPTAAPQGDVWGSFSIPANESTAHNQRVPRSQPDYEGSFMEKGHKPEIVRRPNLDIFSSNLTRSSPAKFQRPAPVTTSSYGEVLFDAADELSANHEDDDEFGDFETGTSEHPPQSLPSQSLNDLFSATTLDVIPTPRPAQVLSTPKDFNGGMWPYPQAPKSPSIQEKAPFAEFGVATKRVSAAQKEDGPNSASQATARPTYEPKVPNPDSHIESPAPGNPLDDEWGDFADLPPEMPAIETSTATSGVEADAWAWDAADRVSKHASAPVEAAPPTNIPPPSVLLPLFPPIFDLPQKKLFTAVANQPFSLKNRIISDPSTVGFLQAYLLIASVATRIIAGRKLRWKRDTLLSQAMKIGPSAAGGKGGMKLTGVDKAETTREDREAAEVVRIWKEHLGRLRSAIAVANSTIHEPSAHLAIPDISDAMHVKSQEGALTAPKACVLCGLKRDERINKVDVQVEDSFGEWWVEHWGHRACRNFWIEHESKLTQR